MCLQEFSINMLRAYYKNMTNKKASSIPQSNTYKLKLVFFCNVDYDESCFFCLSPPLSHAILTKKKLAKGVALILTN